MGKESNLHAALILLPSLAYADGSAAAIMNYKTIEQRPYLNRAAVFLLCLSATSTFLKWQNNSPG